ncbi:MAG: rod shape-determining protein MreC [Alphaproteobacteria bacterium]|nr:rod shape-determining protein MreC [Alphaproteobacteria bacterium]
MQEKLHQPMLTQIAIPFRYFTRRWSLFFFLGISIGLMSLEIFQPDFTKRVRTVSMDRLVPVMEVVSSPFTVIKNSYEILRNLTFLRSENERLRIENTRLRNVALTATYVQAENKQLRELLKVPPELKPTYITALVVSSTTGNYVRSATINVGKDNGVEEGQIVINEYGLVGRIIEVGKHSARILLIHDVQSRIPVISSVSQERAIAAGMDGDNLMLMFVPDETHIAPGEIVYTSGDGHYFPQGLIVGKVGKKKANEITVIPSVQRHKLKYVHVVKYAN